MDVTTQIEWYRRHLLHKIVEGGWAVKDIFKTENEREGTTMHHDSIRYPEKGVFQVDWTKLADIKDFTIKSKAPTGKARSLGNDMQIEWYRRSGLLGKDADITVIDEMSWPFLYRIEKVIFNPPATVVIWSDGEKTVVKTSKDDVFSKETGLAMAIAKRYFGSRSKFLEAVENAESEAPETPVRNAEGKASETPVRNAGVLYLCDGKACREPVWCSMRASLRPDIACTHTVDIRHAANFKQVGPNLWFEKQRGDAE